MKASFIWIQARPGGAARFGIPLRREPPWRPTISADVSRSRTGTGLNSSEARGDSRDAGRRARRHALHPGALGITAQCTRSRPPSSDSGAARGQPSITASIGLIGPGRSSAAREEDHDDPGLHRHREQRDVNDDHGGRSGSPHPLPKHPPTIANGTTAGQHLSATERNGDQQQAEDNQRVIGTHKNPGAGPEHNRTICPLKIIRPQGQVLARTPVRPRRNPERSRSGEGDVDNPPGAVVVRRIPAYSAPATSRCAQGPSGRRR